jgi:hypothetical protein
LDSAKRSTRSSNATSDVVDLVEELARQHANFVDDKASKVEPSLTKIFSHKNFRDERIDRLSTKAETEIGMQRDTADVESGGACCRRERESLTATLANKALYDFGFARACFACDKDGFAVEHRIESDLLKLRQMRRL